MIVPGIGMILVEILIFLALSSVPAAVLAGTPEPAVMGIFVHFRKIPMDLSVLPMIEPMLVISITVEVVICQGRI